MERRDILRSALAVGSCAAGGALVQAAVSPATPAASDRFTVHGYGAKGDGRADDTAAVQAAIDVAVKARGGAVTFPSGRYRITRSIRIASSDRLDLIGAGATSVLIHEMNEPLLVWPEQYACREVSIRHLCFTSAGVDKTPDVAVIACLGGAERSFFSHLLFNTAKKGDDADGYQPAHPLIEPEPKPGQAPAASKIPQREPFRMGSGIHVERVMDTTTLEHCLMWGPVAGTGIHIAKGAEVRIIGGRILGAGDPYAGLNSANIGVHVIGNNGGVHLVTTDLIGFGTALKIGQEGNQSNREVFITHISLDSSVHGLVQVDSAYTSIAGCWSASSDEDQILLEESARGAIMVISGGTIFNGGAYGRPGKHHGMVVRAGSFVLSGVTVRHNKGVGILVEGNNVRDYAITGCRIADNGTGAILRGSSYACTGNVFSRNGKQVEHADAPDRVFQNNVLTMGK